MRLLFAALLALPAPAQEEDAIRKLIARLDDDSLEVREKAQKDLVQLGEAALPALRRTVAELADLKDRAEARVRAEAAIREIDLAVKGRQVYRDPRTLTLARKDAALGDVLQEIARQAGVQIDDSAVDRDARVTVAGQDAPLLRVLDDLCRGAKERTWEYTDEGVVRFKKEKHPPGLPFYGGPFRVRLASLRQERSTDFADRSCVLHLTLDANCEKYLKPLKRFDIDLEKVTDDQGQALQRRAEDDTQILRGGGRVMVRAWAGFGGPEALPAPMEFSFKDLSPAAKSVTLQGTLRYTFPLDVREVAFDTLKGGEVRSCGDYQVKLELLMPQQPRVRHLMFRFEPLKVIAGAAADVDRRLEMDSLVGIDEDGQEHRGQFHPAGGFGGNFVIVGGGVKAVGEAPSIASYQANFNAMPPVKGLKKIRFRFADPTLVKSLPFRFENVELP